MNYQYLFTKFCILECLSSNRAGEVAYKPFPDLGLIACCIACCRRFYGGFKSYKQRLFSSFNSQTKLKSMHFLYDLYSLIVLKERPKISIPLLSYLISWTISLILKQKFKVR